MANGRVWSWRKLTGAAVLGALVVGFVTPWGWAAEPVKERFQSPNQGPQAGRLNEGARGSEATSKPAKPPVGKDVFGLTKVHDFQLTLTEKEYTRLQPGALPVTRPTDAHKSFPWARAQLVAGGKTYPDVGVRYKGNYTYGAVGGGLKRSLKIDLDRFDETQRFGGLKKLNLNSGITDPARMREAMGFEFFRAAGVPSPRTAYARVSLTVPGKHDKVLVGLYTLIEQVDGDFLKAHFGRSDGMLLKPEGIRGLPNFGDNWNEYPGRYFPRDPATEAQQKRLIEFTRLINAADDAKFAKEIGSYLDVDAFLRFVAANAIVVNLDSFLAYGHNYYIYLRPDTNQFAFIPWDLDLAWGAWPYGGSPEQQMDLSVTHPHQGENKLIDRLLAIKEVNAKYQRVVREVAVKAFRADVLFKQIDQIDAATHATLVNEAKALDARKEAGGVHFEAIPPGGGGGFHGQGPSLKAFIKRRAESLAAQFAGKSKGFVLQ